MSGFEKLPMEVKITISDGDFLGAGMKCFNLPNNNSGVTKVGAEIGCCKNGAGKNGKNCKDCEDNSICEKQILCPGATVICNSRCYQNNSLTEDIRRVVYNNYLATLQEDFVEKMKEEIEKSVVNKKIKYFRIHSLGEFYNYEYFCDWMEIAEYFRGKVNFTFYTKCYWMLAKYLEKKNLPDNVKAMLSVMPDSLYGSKFTIKDLKKADFANEKSKNISLIKSILDKTNSDVYLTTYTELCPKVIKNGLEWLPESTVQECLLHEEKTCAECIQINGSKGNCYLLENKDGRNRIIVERIRVNNGNPHYTTDIESIREINSDLAEHLKAEIENR